MSLKQDGGFWAGFIAISALLAVTGCSTLARPHTETRRGSYIYVNPFSYKPANPAEHLRYAEQLRDAGKLRKATKEFEIIVKRWPDSMEAAAAQRAQADTLHERGKNKKAFKEYEELIAQYYTGIKNYDGVLERQFDIAQHEQERKRMRWLFGGFRAPERAVPFYESILKNAPQWDRAPEVQYRIGQAYQRNEEYEMAVVAYSTVEFRYPRSPYAEKAAYAKVQTYRELVKSVPYSVDIREQAQIAAAMFPGLYPDSGHIAEVTVFADELRDQEARYTYQVAEFYERIPRPARTDSAVLYYQKTVDEFGGTPSAGAAVARLSELHSTQHPAVRPSAKPADADVMSVESIIADLRTPAVTPVQVFSADEGAGVAGGMRAADMRAKRKSSATAAAGLSGPVTAAPLPQRFSNEQGAVEVTADRMEYRGELLIGDGNVAVQQEGASLQADHVTVNPETGEIIAAGNILMLRGNERWEGHELTYNYKTREGSFGNSMMYFEPAYITAGKTERLSTNEFMLHDVVMTTCEGDNPVVYARAKEVYVIDENKPSGAFIKAKHVTFFVGPVPVFYTPVWQRHLGERIFSFAVGASGRMGAYIMSRAELHPADWLKTNTHLDLYSKRGIGAGQDFRWATPHGGGGIKTYYISDGDWKDSDDSADERRWKDSDRYRVKIYHNEQIDDETYIAAQLNYLSDPDFLDDFFNDEYRHEVNPENYVVVQRSTERYSLGARFDRRMNDFYTTVERIPHVTYDRYRARVGDTPLYFQSENTIGFYENLNAKTINPPLIPNNRSARFDTYNQLLMPLRFFNFLNITPHTGYRGTWYSETATGKSDSHFRHLFEIGALTSFKAYKTLTDQSGFFGTGMRHVFEPYIDYLYRTEPGLRGTRTRRPDLYHYDEIDELDERNEIRFGARNLLQTKRGDQRIANFFDLDLYTSYRFDPQYDSHWQREEYKFGPLTGDLELNITDNFYIKGNVEYDWHERELSPANIRTVFVTADQSEYSFSYRYRDSDYYPLNEEEFKRSLFEARALLFPNSKWSFDFLVRYDGHHDEWEDRRIVVNHRFNCVTMGVGYRCDEDDEHEFWVQFWLNAIKGTPIKL
ncbi:MAG: LPS assembly protein LptD [Kiritimatiellales bacterium]